MPKRTGRPWQRRKARVIRRDAGLCHLCGTHGADTADHLIPWSISHDDSMGNLKAAHVPCNQRRGDMPLDQWFEQQQSHDDTGGFDW